MGAIGLFAAATDTAANIPIRAVDHQPGAQLGASEIDTMDAGDG